MSARRKRTLLLFGVSHLDDMLRKGNVWYIRHYESYFERVYVVYLFGQPHRPVFKTKTVLVSLGTGRRVIDLLLAPFRLLRFARKVAPTNFLTSDLVFSWWTSRLLKPVTGAHIALFPVCIPHEIYRTTGRSLSGLPKVLERRMIARSFRRADRIVMSRNYPTYIEWLSSLAAVKGKLRIVDVLVDELPPVDFYDALKRVEERQPSISGVKRLLYVGRLHKEKLVDDLIRMLAVIHETRADVCLDLIGDGPELEPLRALASKLGVEDKVAFLGFQPNSELVRHYKSADVFVSPLTGTSLREAALCGTPVVAYNRDWVQGSLQPDRDVLVADNRDVGGIAGQVLRVLRDSTLRARLSENLHQLAESCWSREKLSQAIEHTFESLQSH